MKNENGEIFLKDYQPHPFKISHTELKFDLGFTDTVIEAVHAVERNTDYQSVDVEALSLHHENLEIIAICINGVTLTQDQYSIEEGFLSIHHPPEKFTLEIKNRINPSTNTQLSGLYQSGSMLCTQCEAEGFRRITPSIDRPDNLATYQVELNAADSDFPILLCNGNLIDDYVVNGRRTAIWKDPFPKPTYLFAVVAGNLSVMKDHFVTMSGRKIDLHFYAYDNELEFCEYAMGALQRSMEWDEKEYGREYDLDLYNVVAVSDFNMGAMENKSLNVFNTKYVLAHPDIATDKDYQNVERVIGHEYFHNWSGNRVTCRDWFQLSLKEGFTVFRDQEFGADLGSRGVCRIDDVDVLRNRQFPEDAGPMAHPIRPASYKEINNFYTVTIYEKGAEVVRMLQTLVGKENFRKGTDLYFQRHDGCAVTTDDFVDAIGEASAMDLSQFKNWYSQAGTPTVSISTTYDSVRENYTLSCKQHCDPTPGQPNKKPHVIPILTSLMDQNGNSIQLDGGDTEKLLVLDQPKQSFTFENLSSPPIPSIFRGFSSPVIITTDLNTGDLRKIFQHDTDPFNRWEAGQQLFKETIIQNIERLEKDEKCQFDADLIEIFGFILDNPTDDLGFNAKLLTLPGESWLGQFSKPLNPELVFQARQQLKRFIAEEYWDKLINAYQDLQERNNTGIDGDTIALRSMRDGYLSYLGATHNQQANDIAVMQLENATNLTDRISALELLINSTDFRRDDLLENFYQRWQHQDLVIDKWFRLQATSDHDDILLHMNQLCQHSAFSHTNPNRVYSLIGGFCHSNARGFNQPDGQGYQFASNWIEKLDKVNPQVCARIASAFNGWRDLIPSLGDQSVVQLKRINNLDNLSKDVSEIIEKSLQDT